MPDIFSAGGGVPGTEAITLTPPTSVEDDTNDRYIDYTAPSNGFFYYYARLWQSKVNAYARIYLVNLTASAMPDRKEFSELNSARIMTVCMPAYKGDVVRVACRSVASAHTNVPYNNLYFIPMRLLT